MSAPTLAKALSAGDIAAALATLSGWEYADGKLQRTFTFADFVAAFGWMSQVALHAERLGHHPEWCNVYNRVTVALCTHDAGDAVTERDLALARVMSRLA